MAEPVFDRTWLYGPNYATNKERVEVTTQAEHDQFVAMGWKDTPAAFGVETHPQHPIQTTVLAVTGAETPAGAGPHPALAQALAQLGQLESDVVSLQTTVESLTNRLSVLEDLLTHPPAAAARQSAEGGSRSTTHDDASEGSGRRRTS